MNSEYLLYKVNAAFRGGRLFEKIVDALAKAAAGKELNSEDHVSIDYATDFLLKAKKGCEWMNAPRISEESKNCAYSFQMAADSYLSDDRTPAAFIENIEEMLQIASALKSKDKPDKDKINRVRKFFGQVFRTSIEQMNQTLFQEPLHSASGWGIVHK